ncbi:ATP-grasp domain-containing protein [Aquabacter spiritensis]|uniref:Putative ATP-grasp superfamily ATP-dependent carboligase n=1 Tax=Aquabacter spiritensis TaxID=933073 RepID=A0A4V2UXT1_9HYPH|nr:ATP-grasp domain-containing protein [Aquabacter spiritensis]TCT04718.1 putative ATP-grasp superfamily ATP-dependent carboligase [Aquabacter spiritensis]
MRVFVCEFLTSGGGAGKPLPEALLPEGTLMRDAMVADLEQLPGVTVALCHDDRLAPPTRESRPIAQDADPWAVWADLCATAQVVWPLAPETDGLLARLIALARASGARVIGSHPDAIAIASSKSRTAARLAAAGLPVIPTFPAGAGPLFDGPCVTKPDDGAGAVDTRIWPAGSLPPARPGFVVQPFVAGAPASLTVLCRPDGVTLLCANRQHLREAEGRLSLTGLTVGGIADPDGALARLAASVAAACPGLSGIVGIDLILTPEGPIVVEINPRVTTAYAGLHRALGVNPAAFLPELIRAGVPPAVPHLPRAVPVEISVR